MTSSRETREQLGTETGASCPADWDPLSPATVSDPFATFSELRDRCPVAHSDRWGGFWALTRHDDIVAAALETDVFISGKKATIPDSAGADRPPRPPLESDRPQHTEYRRLLAPYFTPKRAEESREQIRAIAIELIESAIEKQDCDLVPVVALPMPALVLCAFLGLPGEDWTRLKHWTATVIDAARAGDRDAHTEANNALYGYVHSVVEGRRAQPHDPEVDPITGLLELRINGRLLDDDEVTGVVRLLLQAGHNTTTNGIGSAYRYLASHPEQQARLRAHPDEIPTAVDEFLRAFSPAQLLARTLTSDIELHGRTMHAGEKVGLFWASANRDSTIFEDPETVDLARKPNRHVAFGYGIHRCIGAHIARLEMCVAVEELLARTSSFELVGDAPENGWPHIGPSTVPVRIQRG
jgi:cytochrome P450